MRTTIAVVLLTVCLAPAWAAEAAPRTEARATLDNRDELHRQWREAGWAEHDQRAQEYFGGAWQSGEHDHHPAPPPHDGHGRHWDGRRWTFAPGARITFRTTHGHLSLGGTLVWGDPWFIWRGYPGWPYGNVVVVSPPGDSGDTINNYYVVPPEWSEPSPGVTLQTPTAPEPAGPAEGAATAFASKLSPLLGGPELVGASFALGELQLARGDYASAVRSFREAVQQAPDDPTARLALGTALTASGDYPAAAQSVRRGLRAMPDWSELRAAPDRALGSAERAGQMMDRLRAAAEADPGDADVRLLLAFHSLAAGDLQTAAGHLEKAIAAGDTDSLTSGLLAEVRHWLAARKPAEGQAGGMDE